MDFQLHESRASPVLSTVVNHWHKFSGTMIESKHTASKPESKWVRRIQRRCWGPTSLSREGFQGESRPQCQAVVRGGERWVLERVEAGPGKHMISLSRA